MLKRLVILAVATFMAVSVSGSPNQDTEKGQHQTKQQPAPLLHAVCECPPANNAADQQAKPNTDAPKWYASVKWTEWLPIIIAALALAVVCYQAWLSRDIARRQLRAYVCVSGANITFRQLEVPNVKVEMKNAGLTPAYDMRYWIGLAIGKYPLKQTLPEPPDGFRMGVSVMPPNGVEPMTAIWDRPIPPEIRSTLGSLGNTVYVYGRAEYRDAFRTQRFTEFRLIFGGLEPMRLRENDGIFSGGLKPDAEGNRAN